MRESKKISVLFLCLLVILGSVFYPSAGAYTAAQNIISGEVYYVKNKFSGKYLDVEHAVDANGTKEGKSCSNGANVFQFAYNGTANDEWILEPANRKSVELGVHYALCNAKKRPVTYPDCEQLGGDCTNFVSQCMLASGAHFRDEWMINKKSGNYPRPVSAAQLDDSWELKTIGGIFGYGASSPWISAKKFEVFWTPKVKTETFAGQYIWDRAAEIIQKDYVRGDMV